MAALVVRLAGAAPARRDLAGPLVAGGSHADELHIPGCPPSALRLFPCPAGVVVEVAAAGVRVAGPQPPPGAALLRDAAAGVAAPAGLHLVILTGPSAGARHALAAAQTLGRGRAATVVLPDPTASRVHARLTVGPDGARLEDLRSKNGVRLNGVRIDRRPVPVRAGDEITLGETTVALADDVPEPRAAAGSRSHRASLVVAALLALSAAALALAAG